MGIRRVCALIVLGAVAADNNSCIPVGGHCTGTSPDDCCDYSMCIIRVHGICTSTKDNCRKKGSGCTVGDKRTQFCCTDLFLDHATATPYNLECDPSAPVGIFNGMCKPSLTPPEMRRGVAFTADDVHVGGEVEKGVIAKVGEYFLVSMVAEAKWAWKALPELVDTIQVVDSAVTKMGKQTRYVYSMSVQYLGGGSKFMYYNVANPAENAIAYVKVTQQAEDSPQFFVDV